MSDTIAFVLALSFAANKIISNRSQLCVYERLHLDPLWNVSQYKLKMQVSEGNGFKCR